MESQMSASPVLSAQTQQKAQGQAAIANQESDAAGCQPGSQRVLVGRLHERCDLVWVDDFNREALAIEVDLNLPAERIIRVLDRGAIWRGYPQKLRLDNGPEL